MAITPVNNGDPANDTWPDAVTAQLNRYQVMITTTDVSKTGTSFSDITGLTAAQIGG